MSKFGGQKYKMLRKVFMRKIFSKILFSVTGFGYFDILCEGAIRLRYHVDKCLFLRQRQSWSSNGIESSWISGALDIKQQESRDIRRRTCVHSAKPQHRYPQSSFSLINYFRKMRIKNHLLLIFGTFSVKFHCSNCQGQLIGVMGKVGGGKSLLLDGILAEITRAEGIVAVHDLDQGFGYVKQNPWLQRGTIRDNILFGKAYDHNKYKCVLICLFIFLFIDLFIYCKLLCEWGIKTSNLVKTFVQR